MNPAVTHLLHVLWGKVFEVLCFLDVQNESGYVFFFFFKESRHFEFDLF